MAAQRDDPEPPGRISAIGAARAGGAAQSSRARRHRQGARRPDPRRTRRAARTRVALGAGVELARGTPSGVGGRAVVRQGPRSWLRDQPPDHSASACAGSVAASQPPARTVNDAEREGQRREGALRAAITPPIATAAFEARSGMVSGEDAERPATCTESGQLPAAIVPAATLPVAQGCHCWPVADAKLGGAAGFAGCPWAPRAPVSPYEVKAQTVILAVLLDRRQFSHIEAADHAGPPLCRRCREGTLPTVPQGVRLFGRNRPLDGLRAEGRHDHVGSA
jgi:hypothetical protein